MGFIRVRSAKGPKHEFEISEEAYRARPHAFKKVSAPAERKAAPVARKAAPVAGKDEKK